MVPRSSVSRHRYCRICDGLVTGGHRCARNAAHCECNTCGEYLRRDSAPLKPLPCGHIGLHASCFLNSQADRECPHCRGATNQWEEILKGRYVDLRPRPLADVDDYDDEVEDGEYYDDDGEEEEDYEDDEEEDSYSGSDGDGDWDDETFEGGPQELHYAFAAMSLNGTGRSAEVRVCGYLHAMQAIKEDTAEYQAAVKQFQEQVRVDDNPRRFLAALHRIAHLACPSPKEKKLARAAINAVARLLHRLRQVEGVGIDRVRKGGSFGRSTSVKSRFDVDLVVFVNHDDVTDELAEQLYSATELLLLSKYGSAVEMKKKNGFLMSFVLWGIEFDVLVARNLCCRAEDGHSMPCAEQQFEALMRPVLNEPWRAPRATGQKEDVMGDKRRELGCMEAMGEVLKEQPGETKVAVRMLKSWTKGMHELGKLKFKVPSVIMELLVVCIQRRLARMKQEGVRRGSYVDPDRPTTVQVWSIFVGCLVQLTRMRNRAGRRRAFVIIGNKYVNTSRFKKFRHCWGHKGPFIIHPVDPTCNTVYRNDVLHADKPIEWRVLAHEASVLLTMLQHNGMHTIWRHSTLGDSIRLLYDPKTDQA